MTMDKLVSSLISDATTEAEEIKKSAEKQADSLITEAKAKRIILLRSGDEEVDRILKEHEKERLAWAKLESKRLIAEAKEDAVKLEIEKLVLGMEEFRKSKEYSIFLKKSVSDALKEFGNESTCTIHLKKGDKKYVSTKAKVLEDLDSSGGVLVENQDRSIIINLTLESVLESRKDMLRKAVYEKMFGV